MRTFDILTLEKRFNDAYEIVDNALDRRRSPELLKHRAATLYAEGFLALAVTARASGRFGEVESAVRLARWFGADISELDL